MRSYLLPLLFAFIVSSFSHSAYGCDITTIEYQGNKTTREALLDFYSGLSVGGSCEKSRLINAQQNLMNTELFKSVIISESMGKVLIDIKEKFYYLPIPQASRSGDGELSIALKLEANNLWGLNHSLSARTKRAKADDGEGNETESHFIRYEVPRFINRKIGTLALFETETAETDLVFDDIEQGLALTERDKVELGLIHWLTSPSSTKDQFFVYGGYHETQTYSLEEGVLPPFTSGRNNGVFVEYVENNIQVSQYRRTGDYLKLRLSGASSKLNSDFSYQHLEFTWRKYIPIDVIYLDNLNIQAKLGYAHNAPYEAPPYTLGGSKTLRGYESNRITGFNFYQINTQWLSAFKKYPTVRWGAFIDLGDATREHDFNINNIQASAGMGLRWKIRSLVKTDLRADVAFSKEGSEAYIGTRSIF